MLVSGTLHAKLTAAISATAATITLDSIPAAFCAALTGGNTTLVKLFDGINTETVEATACTGNQITVIRGVYGTTARAFVAQTCADGLIEPWLCAVIAQGGCTATVTAAACVPVAVAFGATPSDPEVGVPYEHVIMLTGDAPFLVAALVKPAWMTISPVGTTNQSAIALTGTPTDDTQTAIQIGVSNCAGKNKVEFYAKLCYCEQAASV